MGKPVINSRVRDLVTDEAAHWLIRNHDPEATEQSRREFVAWLKASPLHIEEYIAIGGIARELPSAPSDDLETLLQAASTPTGAESMPEAWGRAQTAAVMTGKRNWRSWRWVAGIAASVMMACLLVFLARDGERFGIAKTYKTGHGEQRTWILPDRSVLHLNSGSAVRVAYSPAERVVEVLYGQGMFQVVHEAHRRFRVSAGDAVVIAIGTEFDVNRSSHDTVVTVIAGTVAVFTSEVPALSVAAELPDHALRLSMGERVRVDGSIVPLRVTAVSVDQASAWLRGQIVFERRPLADLVDEFNRYGRIPIEIDDATLRAIPVSGIFNAYDTDSFVAFLRTIDGVVIEADGERIRVTRRAARRAPVIAGGRSSDIR